MSIGVFEPPDADVSWRRFLLNSVAVKASKDMGPSSLYISAKQAPNVCPRSYRIAQMRITRNDKC